MSDYSTPHCQYQHLDNGIDEFVFLTNTRTTVDDYFVILSRLLQDSTQSGHALKHMQLLIELRQSGMPPVAYMMDRYRTFIKDNAASMPDTRVVYLYRSGFILSLVRSFIGLVSERKHANRRFYPLTERTQAEQWLLESIGENGQSIDKTIRK